MNVLRQLLVRLRYERETTYCPYCGLDPCAGLTEDCAG